MLSPRPEVAALKSCYHGGPNYAEFERLGIRPEEVIDFSSNSNPYPFRLDFSIDDVVIDHYPDSDSTDLRRLIAAENGVKPSNVIVGSGSMEVIRLIAQAYLSQSDRVLICKPTFGEYEIACRIAGAQVIDLWAEERFCFRFDARRVAALIQNLQTKAVFICNPNNPTGQYLSLSEIEHVLEVNPSCLLVLDEAYIAFTKNSWDSMDLHSHRNLVIIRSMTKDYALAGLRLGYAIADESIIANLEKVKPPWNVNAIAQRAGIQALRDKRYLNRSERLVKRGRDYLINELSAMGFHIVPTMTNFFLMGVDDAKIFRSKLLIKGLIVRDCTSFGLPQYVRIAPRTLPECRRLVHAIKSRD
ncbi:histidinol-phosphate transaminase [Dehalogenimonas sp. 4OHTPN]|uniref:Aminotransferase n=1 Tax=Dehalogenimonas sp. 4OHTPN TaxID=3166643 RepID=A0AAU8G7H3_9CHLR